MEPKPLIRMGSTFEQDWPGAKAQATECVLNLVRTGEWALDAVARLMKPYGLTPAEAQLLSIVHGAGEPLPHRVIADRLVVSRGMVTWLVNGLEQRGLVRRIAKPRDRRTVLVALTEAGHELHAVFRPRIHQLDARVVGDLSTEEQETLLRLLGSIQARLLTLSAQEERRLTEPEEPA